MENSLVVLETSEFHKTIEEINDEIEPKVFSTNLGIESRPRELSLTEIYEVFNSANPKPPVFKYASEPVPQKFNDSKVKSIEKELLSIAESIKTLPKSDPDHKELTSELAFLTQKLENIKEKGQSVLKKHVFPTSSLSDAAIPDSISNNITYEINLSEVEERNRLTRIETKVREIEFLLGNWKQNRPISEILADFLAKTKFLNLDLLERTKDQAKHLGTDLDIILSTEIQTNPMDNAKDIGKLYHDTIGSLGNINKLPLLLDRIGASVSLFNVHSDLAKNLLNLEASSENTLGKTSQSLVAFEQIVEGLSENRENVAKNLASLQKKLKK